MRREKIWASLDPFFEAGAALGRKAANTQFLRYLLLEDPFDRYELFLRDPEKQSAMQEQLEQLGVDPAVLKRIQARPRMELPGALAEARLHCLHQSDCILYPAHLAALRNAVSPEIFPITSVTHSLSYADHHQAFLKHLAPTVSARDCLVATSTAAEGAIQAFFARLRADYGLDEARFPQPGVRRIPLGVDPETMAPAAPDRRVELRRALGLGHETCCLLAFGRIAHHSKMDVIPLLRAVQRLFASGLNPEAVHLLVAGWAEEEDEYPGQLAKLANTLGLPFAMVKRPTEKEKLELFQAADVFVSIADNPQETFGLTILEAQAAGLPVLASDYDGYRDLVVPGETGLLADTLGPHETELADLLAPLLFDNQYHLLLAQQNVVSVPDLADKLDRLVADPSLRLAMGEAGRRRVEHKFSWPAVIQRWVRLWDELWDAEVDESALRNARHPLNLPYADIFSSYPARVLHPASRLELTPAGRAVRRQQDHPVVYAMLEPFLRLDALGKLLFAARKPAAAGHIVERLLEMAPEVDRRQAWTTLRWAVKQDLLQEAQPW
jgi:glycosyltransferase involved in cell wall biosynthesis